MSEFIETVNGFGRRVVIRKSAVTALEDLGNDETRLYVLDTYFRANQPLSELMEALDEEHHTE